MVQAITSGGSLAAADFESNTSGFLGALSEPDSPDPVYFALFKGFWPSSSEVPHCEPYMFAEWCGRLINVDTPGATSANLPLSDTQSALVQSTRLTTKYLFNPEVQIFQRF